MLGHCGSHPWGQLPYSPRGMTAGRCANAPAGGGLTGGWVCPTPPGGIQKGRPVVFSWRQSASRTFSPSIALPTRIRQPILSVGTVGRFALRPTYPGQGVDDSWAHGLMRQLGQHLGQGSCCPARWFLQGREAFRSCDMAVVLCLGQQRQSASRTLQCCLTEGPPLPHWGCSPHHWPGVRRSVLP